MYSVVDQVAHKMYRIVVVDQVAHKMYSIVDHGQLFSWLSVIIPDVQFSVGNVYKVFSLAVNVPRIVLRSTVSEVNGREVGKFYSLSLVSATSIA
jgi:fructose 1,6-bisphosphatase